MHIFEFKSVLKSFADPSSEILTEGRRAIFSVNGELYDVTLVTHNGDVYISENGSEIPAGTWILKRLARLPLLANRLKESFGDLKFFVSPAATLLQSLETQPDEEPNVTDDALDTLLNSLSDRSPLETSIMYITSDAGEGKTYLINQMARVQAKRYIDGVSDWLLVPIPLGGKHFLRFDDITVGALQNRYRFPYLYYDSFLALVKMGVIVPAFDGFEEMFVENSSGEALSAMGILVSALDSRGALVVAARKAYFEFESLKTQEKLYDQISSYSVGFGKLELHRWGRIQFLKYCESRGISDASAIYSRVSDRLGVKHSLLTRPVLVRRLVDIAEETPTLEALLERVNQSGTDYFSVFVRGIIDREANEKWIDRSGDNNIGTPLLSVDEHCELLSALALAAWEARVDFIKLDLLEFVTEYFCETKRKSAHQTQQIRERIRGHALLISSPNSSQAVEFDHEEFRLFFLGEGLADQIIPLNDKAKHEVLATLRRGVLPKQAQRAFIQAIKRHPKFERKQAAEFLLGVSQLDSQSSYTQENCGSLLLRLLCEVESNNMNIDNIVFPIDSLRDRKLNNIIFNHCHFSHTSMELTELKNCIFRDCHITQLRIHKTSKFYGVQFDKTTVDSVRFTDSGNEIWDPTAVMSSLQDMGVEYINSIDFKVDDIIHNTESEPQLRDIEKLLRYFMRSTHISESVIQIKLGTRASNFIENTLPYLLNNHVLIEIDNHGGTSQRRFRLGKSLESLNRAINISNGKFVKFIEHINI